MSGRGACSTAGQQQRVAVRAGGVSASVRETLSQGFTRPLKASADYLRAKRSLDGTPAPGTRLKRSPNPVTVEL